MKKLLISVLVLVGVASFLQANESEYMPTISGDVKSVFKIQEEHKSPFDVPEWGWDQRAGASNRDSQFARVQADVNVSSGIPGVSQWFAVASLWMDANNADNVDGDDNANVEENKVELTNAFVMWRPLTIQGGRPLGISVGQQTIKATANGAYSHLFGGDLDSDYILYAMSSLVNKPMVNVDFHITENTGIGYAFAKGASDFIQNSAAFDDDYARTHVVYGEFGLGGLQLNAAYQYAQGNRILKGTSTTDLGSVLSTADYGYESNSLNAQISYDINVAGLSLKPYVGYQTLWGDESSIGDYQYVDAFTTKEAKADIITAGGVFSTKIKGRKFTLAGGYDVVRTADFNGLDGIEDGQIDAAVAGLGMGYTLDTAAFAGICGNGTTTYTVAGLDYMYNLEAAFDITDNVTVSIFLHGTKSKTPTNLNVTDAQKAEIAAVFEAMGQPTAAAAGYAEALATGIDTANTNGTEWTDNMSYGLSVTYRF